MNHSLTCAIVVWLASVSLCATALAEGAHRYEHCSSWKKPSSESHAWSYEGACNNCLAEIERRHGVDWKVTDVEFEDKGRSTNTSTDWRGRRTWKCTHCVVAVYNIVRRGHEEAAGDSKFSESEVKIRYKMLRLDGQANVPEHSHRAPAEDDSPAASRVNAKFPYKTLKVDDDAIVLGGRQNAPAEGAGRTPGKGGGKETSTTSGRAAPQETGNRIRSGQHGSWGALPGHESALVPAALAQTNAGKVAVPANVDAEVLADYAKLARLPAIESFFFPLPETVCLPDERTQIQHTTSSPWSANCQLVITIAGGQQAIGTGWLMGPRIVVTAGHCVHEGMDGDYFESVEVIPGMNGPVRPYGSQTALRGKLRASDGWQTSGTLALDYGAILLDEEFQSPTGASPNQFAVEVLSDAQLTGIELFLSGYPADKTFGTQWTDADPISSVLTGRLKYMIDTYGGHSGSAVVPVGRSAAVGIHNYGGCPNFCTRITGGVKADLDLWLSESTAP